MMLDGEALEVSASRLAVVSMLVEMDVTRSAAFDVDVGEVPLMEMDVKLAEVDATRLVMVDKVVAEAVSATVAVTDLVSADVMPSAVILLPAFPSDNVIGRVLIARLIGVNVEGLEMLARLSVVDAEVVKVLSAKMKGVDVEDVEDKNET